MDKLEKQVKELEEKIDRLEAYIADLQLYNERLGTALMNSRHGGY